MRAFIFMAFTASLSVAADSTTDRTQMTPEQVFKQTDQNADGKISPTEFKTVMPSEKHGPQYFKKADKNGDGSLSLEEFKVILESVAWWKLSRKTPEEWLKAFDKDGDGKLSAEEFREIDPHKNHYEAHFKKYQKAGDGKMTLAELKAFVDAEIKEKN